MVEEIKQPNGVGKVLPLNPSRGAGQRKHPRPKQEKPSADDTARRGPDPDEDPPHRVDEYV